MAITKESTIEKIEIVGIFKCLQIAVDTIIKEDNKEISRSRNRHGLTPCTSSKNGDTWTHADTDISGEASEVQAIANLVWTDTVKANYKKSVEEQEG